MIMRSAVLFLVLGLYSMNGAAVNPAYFFFPLEQASIKINSNVKSKQKFNFDIKQHCFAKRCPVKIGLEYVSMRDASNNAKEQSDHIREFFLQEGGRRPRFPLEVGFELYDANSKKVVINEVKPSGELRHGYIHGGTTVTSLFGNRSYHCLSPGAYTAEFQILSAERDVSEFALRLIVLNDSKVTCGKKPPQDDMDKNLLIDQNHSRKGRSLLTTANRNLATSKRLLDQTLA